MIKKYEGKNPIFLLDSGSGGINVANMMSKLMPNEQIIALTDLEFMPYGNKEKRELTRRVVKFIELIRNFSPKLVVIACNTIDSLFGDRIESELSHVQVLRIVAETAKVAVRSSKTKQIGLFATTNTIESQSYMYGIASYFSNTHLYGVECSELATLIEKKDFKNPIINEEIKAIVGFDVDLIILGCTHYSLITNKFNKYYPGAKIVDSSKVVAEKSVRIVEELNSVVKPHQMGSVLIATTKITDDLEEGVGLTFGTRNHKVKLLEL